MAQLPGLITDYLLLEEADRGVLERRVQSLVQQDWVPYGSIAVTYKQDKNVTCYTLQMVQLADMDTLFGGP